MIIGHYIVTALQLLACFIMGLAVTVCVSLLVNLIFFISEAIERRHRK